MHNLDLNLKNSELKDIWIELSKSCSHQCNYCFQSNEKGIDNDPNNLSDEEYLKFINEAIDLGINEVGIPGAGEPFHPKNIELLFKIMENNFKRNVHTTIFSHIEHLNEDLIKNLDEFGNKISLLVKFNSFKPELQDWFDGVEGYTKRRDNLLKLLYKYRFNDGKRLGFVTSIMTKNYDEIPEILRYCRKNNIFPDIDVLLPCGRGNKNSLNPSNEKIKLMFELLAKIDHEEFEIEWIPNGSYVGNNPCNRYNHHMYIDKKGNVRPCLGAYNVNLGNVKTKSLLEMWNSDEMKIIRDRMYDGKCTDCKKFISKVCNSCLGRYTENLNNKNLIETDRVHTINGCWSFESK